MDEAVPGLAPEVAPTPTRGAPRMLDALLARSGSHGAIVTPATALDSAPPAHHVGTPRLAPGERGPMHDPVPLLAPDLHGADVGLVPEAPSAVPPPRSDCPRPSASRTRG